MARVFFVGDSVMLEQAVSFAMLVLGRETHGENPVQAALEGAASCWHGCAKKPRSIARSNWRNAGCPCAFPPGVTVEPWNFKMARGSGFEITLPCRIQRVNVSIAYVRSNRIIRNAVEGEPWFARYKNTTKPTVLVLNTGPHQKIGSVFATVLKRLLAHVRTWRNTWRTPRHFAKDMVFFRTIAPGTENCWLYTRPLNSSSERTHTKPLKGGVSWAKKFAWVNFEWYNSLAFDRFNGTEAVRILDVHPMSALRPDSHVRTQTRSTIYDCLHHNAPGVVDWWNHLLLTRVRRFTRKPKTFEQNRTQFLSPDLQWVPDSFDTAYGIFPSEGFAVISEAKRLGVTMIIESGTANGGSTEMFARAFPNMTIHTLDIDQYHIFDKTAARLRKCCPHVRPRRGDSSKIIPQLLRENAKQKTFVFIDGPKGAGAVKLGLECLKHRSVAALAIHDTAPFWHYPLTYPATVSVTSTWKPAYRAQWSWLDQLKMKDVKRIVDREKDLPRSAKHSFGSNGTRRAMFFEKYGCGLDIIHRKESG